jgi:hypothetical protein
MSSNTNPQVKTEDNPPPPPLPPPQIQEPQQQNDTFPTHGTILTITGGSNTDFDTKWQRRDYYREVNHVAIEGSITQIKWSHIPIIFSAQHVNLASFPHTDAMVLTVHIDRWDISRILIDNGNQVEILFLSVFKKWATTRSNSKNRRSPFDVVDMLYPYNATFGRGLLNTFKAALHSGYLCLKVLATFDIITIFGS